jgi:hypothetical protein
MENLVLGKGTAMATSKIWTYGDMSALGADVGPGVDLTGYGIEALDGGIGKVDEASYDVGSSWLVVDTGPWIFGKKVLLPAGVIDRIDANEERVYVGRTKDQIKNAPEFDESTFRDDAYRSEVASHYGSGDERPNA